MKIETYFTQNTLARKLGVSTPTIIARLRKYSVAPDALAINGIKPPVILFNVNRVADLRRTLFPVIS